MSLTSGKQLILTSAAGGGGGAISRSLRFNSADSSYLSRTPASAGNRKTFTFACWAKLSGLGTQRDLFSAAESGTGNPRTDWRFDSSNNLTVEFNPTGSSWLTLVTSAVFRDTSAWYHVVIAVDTTQASSTNRTKVYANGVEQTLSGSYVSQNTDLPINNTWAHSIGRYQAGTTSYFDGYLADIHFIDGQALDPTSFGEFSATTGVWVPKAYTGSYGTNGFHLEFADNSSNTATTLGKDSSGLGNNWMPNNLSVTAGAGNDSLVDVPTNGSEVDTGLGGEVRGNYATLNPVAGGLGTLSNGNLDIAATGSHGARNSTIGVSSGKWYAEFNLATAAVCGLGITSHNTAYATWPDNSAGNYWFYYDGGSKYFYPGGGTQTTSAGAPGTGIWKIALDLDTGRCWLGWGSIWYDSAWNQTGNPSAGTNPTFSSLPAATYFMFVETQASTSWVANFGQRPFAYTAPSGFKALCTANLPAPTVVQPSTVMDVKLYTGNGSTQTISGLGFSPDLVWGKNRVDAASNQLYDTVRGAGKVIYSNSAAAEEQPTDTLSAFTSSGFTLDAAAALNASTKSFVAWAWDAGSSTVTNTVGSITSSVRANATAGFSVVTYTGTGSNATVGHGLGVAPFMFIVKNRSTSSDWDVYHGSLPSPATNRIVLQSTAAAIGAGGTSAWNSTSPTSTVVSLGSSTSANANGNNHVMYCFAPVNSYSSFGSYVGNGSADGSFIYTGHRTRFLLIKAYDATATWSIFDAARDPYNVGTKGLYPNSSGAEESIWGVDFLSNGFKLRTSNGGVNQSGLNYIYASFAESPFAANNRAR